ncbi:hypothetical protein [Tumebacillus flagellatus]|uniref:Uncharacterized protein n=1 Tax=Tumebacillus flagellatus TaxID=1157490 RepID=A0A074M477_9BACL|nr:hypothetical protein [Tumebacillus flagellatus]KEO80807.1 hypothetical protein EL26_24295 [Tumebacillus flagellatus]
MNLIAKLAPTERPKKTFNHADREQGKYNFADPTEVSVQFRFWLRPDAPKELSRSFLLPPDKDTVSDGTALEMAMELKAIYDGYFFTTNKPKIAALVAYLEEMEIQDQRDLEKYNLQLAYFTAAEQLEKARKITLNTLNAFKLEMPFLDVVRIHLTEYPEDDKAELDIIGLADQVREGVSFINVDIATLGFHDDELVLNERGNLVLKKAGEQ